MKVTEHALPCDGQTKESIHAWAQSLQIGDTVVIRHSSSLLHYEYRLQKVEAFTDEGRRVLVTNAEGTFWRTPNAAGQNCMHPKGQTHMIEPTPAVKKAARAGERLVPGEKK